MFASLASFRTEPLPDARAANTAKPYVPENHQQIVSSAADRAHPLEADRRRADPPALNRKARPASTDEAYLVKASRRMLFARTIALCAACVFARALSITKSWIMPSNRTAVTRTPA
jgi:hypothetical protein